MAQFAVRIAAPAVEQRHLDGEAKFEGGHYSRLSARGPQYYEWHEVFLESRDAFFAALSAFVLASVNHRGMMSTTVTITVAPNEATMVGHLVLSQGRQQVGMH